MAEPSDSPTASQDVIRVAGPLLFGRLFNWTLYADPTHPRPDVYSNNSSKDPRPVKFLGSSSTLLGSSVMSRCNLSSLLHLRVGDRSNQGSNSSAWADMYYWFVAGFGDVERFGKSHFSPIDAPIMTAVTSFTVQGYFCYRIWVLTNRRSWICWIIAVMAVTQAAAEIWLSITSLMAEKYVVSKTALYVRILVSVEAAATPSHVVVLVMVYTECHRGHFDFRGNDVAAEKGEQQVLQLRIGSRASAAVATLVLYVAFPNGLYYAYTVDILGKLYSNTLLVSLNNRIYFREHKLPGHGDSAFLTVTDGVRATALPSPRFAVPEPQLRTPTGDNSQLCTISQTVELDSGNGDSEDTSTNWSPYTNISERLGSAGILIGPATTGQRGPTCQPGHLSLGARHATLRDTGAFRSLGLFYLEPDVTREAYRPHWGTYFLSTSIAFDFDLCATSFILA
ncbi:hypothetical protein EDB92DRAFT_1987280 [Lactarius akahatsu]|uniref:Uncharacterized protein n=1 Tax=Lactarius akahatsu TaxID=416441 RepID=A0AAD4L6F9_9AGAM|nr:hypothetical protein EDB92DRAFT_1987280 [Lactarius akahatsu]